MEGDLHVITDTRLLLGTPFAPRVGYVAPLPARAVRMLKACVVLPEHLAWRHVERHCAEVKEAGIRRLPDSPISVNGEAGMTAAVVVHMRNQFMPRLVDL